ncbi:hypothetical protein B5U98_29415 [Bosea sp. Tri-39]|uniref:hypothetical protein n=2 Tax=Bosea TaxID=85413 RepID=UPI000F752733|nr:MULTISPECIES: hypothetical protein [unclassified Bosea (in: a-proteobacteria)]AZO79628.1 hypothetical protein BLM15_19980 [Bosea sp. Tri-49]RXT16127.1 hypothetical protein B5U98_29415 [Bosea sp. Tri-39]RXT39819.1 hypothetical protein B5U99_06460 [Bosea sp. Tri-54]
MTRHIAMRIERLEQACEVQSGRFIMWSDSDEPDAPLERIELCGLSHEECLDLLDEPEALQ